MVNSLKNVMTPAEQVELEACLKRASEILYNNSDTENLKNLEDIENTVRKKILEEVSPRIGVFLSSEKLKQIVEKKEL